MNSPTISLDNDASMLARAMNIAGSIEALARHLHVPKKQLGSWLAGDVETPHGVFLRVVEFLRSARS